MFSDFMERTQCLKSGLAQTAIALATTFLASCMAFEQSGLPGSAASMAHNQIMLVSTEPQETFGHYRLVTLMGIYPDLKLFTEKNGIPDFLAETKNRQQPYYILYYLNERKAFAARTRSKKLNDLEFAGPYPITDKEKQTLQDLQKNNSLRFSEPSTSPVLTPSLFSLYGTQNRRF